MKPTISMFLSHHIGVEQLKISQFQFHLINHRIAIFHIVIRKVIGHFYQTQVQAKSRQRLRVDWNNDNWRLDLHLQAQTGRLFIRTDHVLLGRICRRC